MHLPTPLLLLLSLISTVLTSPLVEVVPVNQLSFSSSSSSSSSFFACPTWKVRCVKDNKWPSGIVGDIGKKPFCFSGFRCNQCQFEENTQECNETFEECENDCTAYAPIPF